MSGPKCQAQGCTTGACYNYEGKTKRLYCAVHGKPLGMVNVANKRCREHGCDTIPTYNYEGQTVGVCCQSHGKPLGMVDVKSVRCKQSGCTTQPTFNYEGETKKLYCKTHGESLGMVDVTKRRCSRAGCKTVAAYNFDGEVQGLYCKFHAEEGMVDVRNQRCAEAGCSKRPTYNLPGTTSGLYCSTHGLPLGMVNVLNYTCCTDGCYKQPTYNFEGQTKGIHCSEHGKALGMVNVVAAKCLQEGCTTTASYNFEGQSKRLYCETHGAPLGMVNVITRRCKQCTTQALYNFCGLKPDYCFKHKAKLMVKEPRHHCEVSKCRQVACFGEREPERCEDHCRDEDLDFRVAQCKQCQRAEEYLDNDGLCRTFCSPVKLVELERKWQKRQEEYCLRYLDDNMVLPSGVKHLSDDLVLDRSCNLYRPDRVYDCGTHYAVFEVDENQHRNRGSGCILGREGSELKRMHEIQSAAGVHCIFLRFNPDIYRVNHMVMKTSLDQRMKLAVRWLHRMFKMTPTKHVYECPVQYKYLFYDEHNSTDVSFLEVDDTALGALLS